MLKDRQYREQYIEFMDKMLNNGYARKCLSPPLANEEMSWYLCHHGVKHQEKRLRVVFDCSARFDGRCLNDELIQSPDLTNHLLGVLLRFRKEKVAFTADIEGMYLQVRVPENQRCYLRFLWWPEGNIHERPQDYEMCTHVFGAISSPSCANFALRQTAEDNSLNFGEDACETLSKDFYVDDLIKSVESTEYALSLIPRLHEMCLAGAFKLVKFLSNSPDIVISIPPENRASSVRYYELSKTLPIEKALGVTWCVEADTLGFHISLDDTPLTRRKMLSTISSIYDVFGLVSPFLLRGRKILQEITAEKQEWDDPVSDKHASQWAEWRRDLPLLEHIKVSRCFKSSSFGVPVDIQLHNFADAAIMPGYGQVSYLRQVDETGKIEVCLVMAKSRVTPLKPVTIPRLELTSAVLSTKVGTTIKRELNMKKLKSYYLSDSMVVLGYI